MADAAALLPGERRRVPNPSVEEASTPARSVRSIRARFESADTSSAPPSVARQPTSSSASTAAAVAAANAAATAPEKQLVSASAPATPAKKRTSKPKPRKPTAATTTKNQLAAFIKERSSNTDKATAVASAAANAAASVPAVSSTSKKSVPPPSPGLPQGSQSFAHLPKKKAPSPPSPSAKQLAKTASAAASASSGGGSGVNSLIEKFSAANSAGRPRPPLAERHLQRGEHPSSAKPAPGATQHAAQAPPESVDTFGSSADFDRVIPKTDPGRLEGYAAPARLAAALQAVVNHPASGDQSMREYATRGLHQQAPRPPPGPRRPRDAEQTEADREEADHRLDLPRTPPFTRDEPPPVQLQRTEMHMHLHQHLHQQQAPSGAELVAAVAAAMPGATREQQASATAAAAGSHDRLGVPLGGVDDEYIQQLFSKAEDTAERAVQFDEEDDYFQAFELYSAVVDLYYQVIPFLSPEQGEDVHERIKMYTRRCTTIQQAFEIPESSPITPGATENDEAAAAAAAQSSSPEQHQPTPPPPHMQHPAAQQHQPTPRTPQDQQAPWKPGPAGPEAMPSSLPLELNGSAEDVLKRTPFPDFAKDGPGGGIATPPARGGGDPRLRDRGAIDVAPAPAPVLSASTQAHRDSLSRPISPSKVRASTNSVSREKVAEMQERVNLMQECLNNFTVKRKHLGPARALELAVTTLNANTFGDLKKLEPLSRTLEHKWATELEVLLSMLKEVKEVRPGIGPALREDIAKHLPALEKCDKSVRDTMRSFSALAGHVRYVDRETAGEGGRTGQQRWWIKVPVVDRGGLKPEVFAIVEAAEREMRVVFKVCRAINVDVVKTIPVPPQFVETLPKHARHLISKELKEGLTTWGMFKVSDFMKDRSLWNKKDAKEITSNLEKVALIWEARTSNKSFLSRTFDIRGERFHQAMTAFRRCQNAIRDLRRDWPTMSQTELDMAKIQHNQDIGLAGLEAYSRALESRAYRLLTRIRELLDADDREKKGLGEGAIVPVRR